MRLRKAITLSLVGLLASALAIHAQPAESNKPAAQEKIWNLSEVNKLGTAPTATSRVVPKRPASVTVLITFVVQEDGSVDDVRPPRGANDAYANAAVEAVKKWKFKPGTIEGKPVKVRLSVPITFSNN